MWSESVISQFAIASTRNDSEKQYYGPYNKLLSIVFPPDSKYTIFPVIYPVETNRSVDYTVEYLVMLGGHQDNTPVLFIEIKSPGKLAKLSARREAHVQMLNRYAEFGEQCRIPIFYGISAFGTLISIYKYNTHTRNNTQICT
jgi:hypothetical protein